jgi:hypothetical protein
MKRFLALFLFAAFAACAQTTTITVSIHNRPTGDGHAVHRQRGHHLHVAVS